MSASPASLSSPDLLALASVDTSGRVVLWQLDRTGAVISSSESIISEQPDGYAILSAVAWSPSGMFLVVAMQRYVALLEVSSGNISQQPRQYLKAHSDWVYGLSWSAQTGLLASGGGDGVVK
eukprot:scaffold266441_cov54-Prasinocladus_malaysianus.AAC.1